MLAACHFFLDFGFFFLRLFTFCCTEVSFNNFSIDCVVFQSITFALLMRKNYWEFQYHTKSRRSNALSTEFNLHFEAFVAVSKWLFAQKSETDSELMLQLKT